MSEIQLEDIGFGDTLNYGRFLQILGYLHISIARAPFHSINDKFYNCLKEITFCGTLEDLVYSRGLPADWAFTIFSLYLHVYSDFNSALVTNFLFKNYFYKLRGAKQIAFLANFFASLQYKHSFYKTQSIVIRNVGTCITTRFDNPTDLRYPEFRVYITFTYLFMADLWQKHNRDECLGEVKVTQMVKAARAKLKTLDSDFPLLKIFLDLFANYYEPIASSKRKDERPIFEHDCHVRWRKAIVSNLFFDRRKPRDVQRENSYFVNRPIMLRWIERLGDYTENKFRDGFQLLCL